METTNSINILNKKGIDSLIKMKNNVINQNTTKYKKYINKTVIEFSKYAEELYDILNTFDYLENNKLKKVVSDIILSTNLKSQQKFCKNDKYERNLNFIKNSYSKFIGIEYTYTINEDKYIKFIFTPYKEYNIFNINFTNVVSFNINIKHQQNDLILYESCTDTEIKSIYENFYKELEIVCKEYEFIIKILLLEIDSIDDLTPFE
jgi:hypothetical protein